MFAWFQLFRIPNIFTLAADVVMVWFLLHAFLPDAVLAKIFPTFCLAGVGSAFLYLAGMALNDVHDVQEDALLRPERPIPSGKISRKTAAWVGGVMLGLGVACYVPTFWISGSFGWTFGLAVLLAICVLAYNTPLKDTFFGPITMGVCRGLNILTLLSFLPLEWLAQSPVWIVPLAICVYIAGVTFFARGETEAGMPQTALATVLPVVVMALGIGLLWNYVTWMCQWNPQSVVALLAAQPWRWSVLIGLLVAWLFVRGLTAAMNGPLAVRKMMKPAIFTLFILDAALAFSVAGLPAALIILALMLPAVVLGTWIAST